MSKATVLVVLAALVAACPILAMAQVPGGPAPTIQIVPPAATAPAAPKVVATVGEKKITDQEVSAVLQQQTGGQPVPPEYMTQIRGQVLEQMIERELLDQFIAGQKIVIEKKDVDAEIEKAKAEVAASGRQLEQLLQMQGMTMDDLRKRIAEGLPFMKYAESQATDEKLQAYFAANKQEFDGSQVKASHILLGYKPNSTPAEKKAANDKIAAIRAEIAGGTDFAKAAEIHSACPSGKQAGGDLGFFGRSGQMVEPFATVAFTTPIGQVSQPVETEFGVHLIKVTETKPGDKKFDDVKDAVKDALMQQSLQNAIDQQRKVTKVEIVQ